MINYIEKKHKSLSYRVLSAFIAFTFLFTSVLSPSYAQVIAGINLPVPGAMVGPSSAFVPVLLKGLTIHPENPLQFDFIVDSGNTKFNADDIKKESERLVKYFLASMTIPKDDLWVNLSPAEKDRIVPDELGRTELGRDMLAQDYILKQLTATLMYPEKELGKKFWDKVYKEAQEKFGTTEIPVDTFNKVWILPDTATVYEHDKTVYVVNARLKVMLEADYVALQHASKMEDGRGKGEDGKEKIENRNEKSDNQSSILDSQSSIIKEIILPAIEKEVNEGQNFAPLRQIYHSLILAKWYKETIKNSLLSKIYIDQKKIAGINLDDATIKDQIYAQYMEAYKKGVFNYIKEDYDRLSNEVIPRKYFSGGITDLTNFTKITLDKTTNPGSISSAIVGDNFKLSVQANPQKDGTALSAVTLKEEEILVSDLNKSFAVLEAEKFVHRIKERQEFKVEELGRFGFQNADDLLVWIEKSAKEIIREESQSFVVDKTVKAGQTEVYFSKDKGFVTKRFRIEDGKQRYEDARKAMPLIYQRLGGLVPDFLYFDNDEPQINGKPIGVVAREIKPLTWDMIEAMGRNYVDQLFDLTIKILQRQVYVPEVIRSNVGLDDHGHLQLLDIGQGRDMGNPDELDDDLWAWALANLYVMQMEFKIHVPSLRNYFIEKLRELNLEFSFLDEMMSEEPRPQGEKSIFWEKREEYKKPEYFNDRKILSDWARKYSQEAIGSGTFKVLPFVSPEVERRLTLELVKRFEKDASSAVGLSEEYRSLQGLLQEAFDPSKSYDERISGLVGRRRFVKKNTGYEPVKMDGIALSYLIGRTSKDRDVYNQLVDLGDSFKNSLPSALKKKIVFLNPASYHVTTVDIAALKNKEKYKSLQPSMQSRVEDFLRNMPGKFKGKIKAKVVGVDMFPPGILKFKLEMDKTLLDDFGRALWDYLSKYLDLQDIYEDVPFKPGKVTYHITLGYVMEPLFLQEIDTFVKAMSATSAEDKHIVYNQPVGELNGFSDMNTFYYIKDQLKPSSPVVDFEESLAMTARNLGYQVDDQTKFILHLGDTVEQSKYHRIFNSVLKKAGLNVVFVPVKTFPEELSDRMKMFKGSEKIVGANITSPHKVESMNFVDQRDENAQIAGSINGIVKDNGRYKGITSDGDGWVYWYTQYLRKSLARKNIVILGSGGATRSLVKAIFGKAPDVKIILSDMDEKKSEDLIKDVLEKNANWDIQLVGMESINAKIKDADIVINFTGSGKSLNENGEAIPNIDYSLLKGKEAIDANYRFQYPGSKNEFLKRAESTGAEIYNGLGFLVGTIPLLFEAFTGKQVNFDDLMALAKDPNGLGLQEAGPVVIKKGIKKGVKDIPVAVWTFDPKEYTPHVIVAEDLEGKLSLDRKKNQPSFNGEYVDQDVLRKEVPLVDDLKKKFLKKHPDLKIVGMVGNENLFYEVPVVTVVGDRIFYALNNTQIEDRDYPMYVVWPDRRVTIEENVQFELKEDRKHAKVKINGKEEVIAWATGIQLIVSNGDFMKPTEDLAFFFSDVKHLFVLPKIKKAGLMSDGVFFMADQILADPKKISQYFGNPDQRQEFKLTYSFWDKEKKVTRNEIISEEELVALLEGAGYKKDSTNAKGDFSFGKDGEKDILYIRLKENGYPFHIVGVTKDGQVKEIATRGEGMGYNNNGITIREAAQWLKEEGIIKAGIIDQGRTVRLNVGNVDYFNPTIDDANDPDKQKATSIIVYTKRLKAESSDVSSPLAQDLDKLSDVGGIDMNSIDLDHQGQGENIQFDSVELQAIFENGVDGFAPVIINITPLPSVLPLLGLDPASREEEREELASYELAS